MVVSAVIGTRWRMSAQPPAYSNRVRSRSSARYWRPGTCERAISPSRNVRARSMRPRNRPASVPPRQRRTFIPMPFSVPPLIDLGAVLVGGLSGTLLAVRPQFDLVGCVSLAIVAGVGGGGLRRVLLQQGPPAALP